jgi:outer membrane protein OmpA-like peptidoglycan-associated protein
MAANVSLIDAVNARVSPGMISAISHDVGASPLETNGAVKRAIPTVLAGMLSIGSTEVGAARLHGAALEAHASGLLGKIGTFGILETTDLGIRGQRMLGSVFGDRANFAIDGVARDSAVARPVATRALGTITPIALAALGKLVTEERLDAGGLLRYLGTQRASILESSDLPHGLDFMRPFGLSDTPSADPQFGTIRGAETVNIVATPMRTVPLEAPRESLQWGWLAAIVGVLLVMLLLWGALTSTRRVQEPHVRAPVIEAPTLPAPAAAPTSETTTTGATIERPDWNTYTVHFQFAGTSMTSDGEDTVKKLADALIANPNDRIKLVGHTDSVGTQNINKPLALSRAVTVKNELVKRGVDASRIDVTGPGETNPVGDNTTKDGRAANRRVEVTSARR